MKTKEPNQPIDEKKSQSKEETVVIGVKLKDLNDIVTEQTGDNKEFLKSTAAITTATAAIATATGTIIGVVRDKVNDEDVIVTSGEPLADNAEVEITPQVNIAPEEVIVDVQKELTPHENKETLVNPDASPIQQELNEEIVDEESFEEPEATVDEEISTENETVIQGDGLQQEGEETEVVVEEETIVEPGESLNDEEPFEEQEALVDEESSTENETEIPEDEIQQEGEETEVVVEEETIVEPGDPLNDEEIAQEQEDIESETSEVINSDLTEEIVSPGVKMDDSNVQGDNSIEPMQIQLSNVNPSPLEIELAGVGDDMGSQTTLFTVHELTVFDDGESQNAAVSITNNDTGEEFMLVDTDGDGIYESVYDADGEFVSNAGGNIRVDDIKEMVASNEDFVTDPAWQVLHPHYDMAAATDELIYSDDSADQPDEIDVDDSLI